MATVDTCALGIAVDSRRRVRPLFAAAVSVHRRQVDEQEATLHLHVLGAMLTIFPQEHADYNVVSRTCRAENG